MVRSIGLMLVICMVGVALLGAPCVAACTVSKCTVPGSGCHHHRPAPRQCLHQLNLSQSWVHSASRTGVDIPDAGIAVVIFQTPVVHPANPAFAFAPAGPRPPGPPLTSLRI